jgi:hypothetical protein
LKPAYSFSWAFNVVQDLKSKYPRATEFVWKLLDITDKHATAFLAFGDKMWIDLRDLTHRTQKWLEINARHPDYETYVWYMSTRLESFTGLHEKERLTARIKRTSVEEQVSRQRGGGLPAEPSQPSLFPEFNNADTNR